MADYRVQLSARKGGWAGDNAFAELTATVHPTRRGIPPCPAGRRVIFDCQSGVYQKDTNNVGNAYLTLTFHRAGVFGAGAILEGEPDSRDTCEVVIPAKPEKLQEMKKLLRPDFFPEGDDGDYIISSPLVWEDGSMAVNEPVWFHIYKLGRKVKEEIVRSDTNGFVKYHLTFSEPDCDVTIQVREFTQRLENLYGPPRRKVPPPVPKNLGFFGRWWFRFRTNNNWRLVAVWMALVLWLGFNLWYFGLGKPIDFTAGDYEAYSKMDEYDKFFEERWRRLAEVSLPKPKTESLGDSVSWWSWRLWWLGLLGGFFYISVVFSDEFSRARRRVERKFREKRGSGSTGGSAPTSGRSAEEGRKQALTLKEYLSFEFLSDFIQELLAHTIFRGRR